MIKLFVLLFFAAFCSARWSEELKVRIEDGEILGRYMTSLSGKTIRSFMGIPYAEPPIGDLRFRSPVKKAHWNGVLKTQIEPSMCSGVDPFGNSTEGFGQEDCLYLNVYAPNIDPNSDKKLPVMVFFHGGAWFFGTGGYSGAPPEYFLEEEVILVAGNYRLGILGFLSFEDAACPGNFGLKDQALMLKWVKMNIDKFGGDSNRITIFGESAGSASVNYHLISPMSKGLFNQAIQQSGPLMSMWSDPARSGLAKTRAIKLAEMMNCEVSTNYQQITECLRKVDSKKLTEAMFEFFEWGTSPIIPFPPVVEDFHEDPSEAFISNLNYGGNAFEVPLMIGMTSEDGLMITAPIFSYKEKREKTLKEWQKYLPLDLYYDHLTAEDQEKITDSITKFYLTELSYDENKQQNFTNLFGDAFFAIGMIEILKLRLKNNHEDNTFVYVFSHKGPASFSGFFGDEENFYGTCHGDDNVPLYPLHVSIPYMFSSIPSEEDRVLSKNMVKLWVNFATNGKPTGKDTKESKYPHWTSARNFPIDYMFIGNANGNRKELFTMEKLLYEERYRFWEELKSKYQMMTKWSVNGK